MRIYTCGQCHRNFFLRQLRPGKIQRIIRPDQPGSWASQHFYCPVCLKTALNALVYRPGDGRELAVKGNAEVTV